jgi:dephospho-CoA kinase
MLKIALTGGIATGKSYVLDRFRRLGVPCLDADALAHGVMAPGTEATQAIAARFGPEVLAEDGTVDRTALGAIVFAEPAARRELEALVHPAVYRSIAVGLRAFELVEQAPLAIVAIPLLYETDRQADFDKVIATVCLPALQVERLSQRGIGEADARRRLAAQLPADEKAARADYVIRTDGTFEDTDVQVDQIWSALQTLARG